MNLEARWPVVRDILSFGVGAYIVISALQETPKDPITLALGAGLMGVPALFGKKDASGV